MTKIPKDIYEEQTVGDRWCYKYQAKGKKLIIVEDIDKETARKKIIKEIKNQAKNDAQRTKS